MRVNKMMQIIICWVKLQGFKSRIVIKIIQLDFSEHKMFIHHMFKTPLKNKSKTISHEPSQILQQTHDQNKQKEKIQQLYSKFNTLNSTIDIDTTKNNFNLIEYEKQDDKIRYDPQMMTAKLRSLQNKAEINRIQMELEQRRKKKKHNAFKLKNNDYQTTPYKKTYQAFLVDSKLIDMPANDSESQDEQTQVKPKGISRFHQLKKHSKILEFTMQKLKQKQQNSLKQQKQYTERKENVRGITNSLKDYGQFADIATKKISATISVTSEYNPEVIIQDKFKRIMTMKAKDKVSEEVKKNPRCNKMMNFQNDILLGLEQKQKSLSKENAKKLKSRFIQIVNQLQKGDKKRKQNKFLPSIDLISFTQRAMSKNKRLSPLDFDRKARKTFNTKNSREDNIFQHQKQQSHEQILQNELAQNSQISQY